MNTLRKPLLLHVAAAQIHAGGGTPDILQRLERQVAAAAAVGVQVILFAEGVLHGYDPEMTPDFLHAVAEPVNGPTCRQVSALARRYGLTILAGFLEREAGRFYNSCLVARPDGTRTVQRKHVLTPAEQQAGLEPGPAERTVFDFHGVRAIIAICADGGIRNLGRQIREKGVMYRFCPTGGGGRIEEFLHEEDLQTPAGRRRYLLNQPRVFLREPILARRQCPFTGFTSANALGPIGPRTCHQGHCIITDNNRVLRAQIPGTIVLEHQQDQMIHALLRF